MSVPASLYVLVAVLFLAVSWCVWSIHNAPLTEPEPSQLDAADGVGTCHMAHCHYAGTITRVTAEHVGLEVVRVCPGCSDLGDARGWWAS